jgi:hypothetical protein
MLTLCALLACTSEEPIGPDGAIDYQGTWAGTIGPPTAVQRLATTWTPTHTRNTVTGHIVFQLGGGLTARGTLTATVIGDVLEFSLTVPPGAYPAPVSQSCSLTATGVSTTATATDIVADLAMNWTPPCVGTLVTAANADHRLTLLKTE